MVARPKDLAHDDPSLVLAAQAGDAAAFSELFRRHYAPVKRVVARKLGNLRDADEIAQAAFVRAYERIDRCGGDRRFGAWVQVIANNLAVDHLRALQRTQPSDDPLRGEAALGPNAPEDFVLDSEKTALMRRALDTLPGRQRDVIVARDVEGRRPPEIAAALGLTLSAVDSALLRGRRRLAATVQSMSAETGAASLATTSAVTATGAVARFGSVQRMVQAVGDLVSRASFQVASSFGMVPGADSVASHAAQVAAAGLISLVPAGGVASIAVPDAAPEVTTAVAAVTDAVSAAPSQVPTAEPPAVEPAPVPEAPTVDPNSAPQPAPAPAPAPEHDSLLGSVVGGTTDAVGGLLGGVGL